MDDLPSFPMIENLDHEILMHRDVHFSGSFSLMHDYYAKEGKGIRPEITLDRILELQRLENHFGNHFSHHVLHDQEQEDVRLAKEKYRSLKQLYSEQDNIFARLIADLILSEDENPSQEIAVIAAQGEHIVPALIELLDSEDFFNPLFPGYGEAPALAARCLGLIGDERAIRPLFGALGREDFFMEESIFDALALIGDKAKEFLLCILKKMPVTKENEQAAIALIGFKDDPEIAIVFLHMLLQENTLNYPIFAAYLIMGCHGLKDVKSREVFIQISQRPNLPLDLRQEMDVIIKKWKKKSSMRN